MAALTASDVSVSLPARDQQIAHGTKIISMPSISFGDGAKTYPSGGVPLPALGQFGLKRQVDMLLIQQPAANGFVYKYDPDNHKIKIFTQGVVTGSTAAASNEDGALVTNSAGAEGVPRLPNTAPDTTYDLGGMIELPATVAPAAVELSVLLVGE